jgi:predicted nucleotidyltransferase
MGENILDSIIDRLYKYFCENQQILFAYLFGSYADDTANDLSDIDVAVYYDKSKYRMLESEQYLSMKMELEGLLKKDVDIIVLNEAKPFLKSRIINKHIKIFSRDTLAESRFISQSLGEYFDILPYLDMEYERAVSILKEGIQHG